MNMLNDMSLMVGLRSNLMQVRKLKINIFYVFLQMWIFFTYFWTVCFENQTGFWKSKAETMHV